MVNAFRPRPDKPSSEAELPVIRRDIALAARARAAEKARHFHEQARMGGP